MGFTILVVDDELIIQRLVAHTLRVLNVELESALDGRTALEIARTTRPGLALIDINLPDMDGFTLMESFEAIPHMAGVPMIAFTARNDPEDEARALALGAKGLLYKPFSTAELRELVQRFLT
jgi:two-component system OmpR family response regulator